MSFVWFYSHQNLVHLIYIAISFLLYAQVFGLTLCSLWKYEYFLKGNHSDIDGCWKHTGCLSWQMLKIGQFKVDVVTFTFIISSFSIAAKEPSAVRAQLLLF